MNLEAALRQYAQHHPASKPLHAAVSEQAHVGEMMEKEEFLALVAQWIEKPADEVGSRWG